MNEHPLILFDGQCRFCNGSVYFIVRRDPAGVFEFASQQSTVGQKLLAARGLMIEPDTLVLLDRHYVYLQSDAVIFILRHLRSPWPLFGLFLSWMPRPLREWGYRAVARRRYRLFGRAEACVVFPAHVRRRFID